MVWVGFGTKTTWLDLGKDSGLGYYGNHCHGYHNKNIVEVVERSKIKERLLVSHRKQTVVSCVKVLCFIDPSIHSNLLPVWISLYHVNGFPPLLLSLLLQPQEVT